MAPLYFGSMRYHFEINKDYHQKHGLMYCCDHPVYDRCTLYLKDNKGLAVIQQRYKERTKSTWWGELDPWIADAIFEHPNFNGYFEKRAKEPKEGLYPTVTVRQLMWALRMKPLKRSRWETVFDRREV